ncbi:MAG: hypothetical protein LBO04_07810 [Spirochaetaceae bacterium]|nr:hypothetical protein [Spirochaetaceae bacterium]
MLNRCFSLTRAFPLCVFLFCARFVFSHDVLRGEVCVELEPVYARFLGVPSPLDSAAATQWAVEDAAAAFSGIIYGWAFFYEPGERMRGIQESLELEALGEVRPDDTRLELTDVAVRDGLFYMQADYSVTEAQKKRILAWKGAPASSVQSTGYGPLQGGDGVADHREIKAGALKDAMKKAIRGKLRINERNRPRSASGYIALSKFPLYGMRDGRWAAVAEFRMEIKEVVPFAAY